MRALNGDSTDEVVPVICPSCDDLLELDGDEDVQAGETIRVFCPTCARTVEVTAPAGIERFTTDEVDRVAEPTVTEFTAGPAREPS